MAAERDRVMAEIYRKIDREKALLTAASTMQKATNNAAVQARADTEIREGRKNIDYLEERLRTLQMQMQSSSPPPPPQHGGQPSYGQGQYGHRHGQSSSGGGGYDAPVPPPKDPNPRPYGGQDHGDGYGNMGPPGHGPSSPGMMPPAAPFADPRPFQPVPKARPNFSKLGMNRS